MFLAYHKGYELRQKESVTLAIQTGYYSGYYNSMSKGKKKSPAAILKAMYPSSHSKKKPDVDVDRFKKLEQAFKDNASKGKVVKRGGI